MSENTIKRYSANELRAKQKSGAKQSDWVKVDALTEEEIERNADEDDLELGINGWDWDSAQLVIPSVKKTVNMRLDPEIVNYFRSVGPGYQTRINAVLRHYVSAKLKKEQRKNVAST